jgi:hypothetical protein
MLGIQRPNRRRTLVHIATSGRAQVWTQVKRSSYEVASETATPSGQGGIAARG